MNDIVDMKKIFYIKKIYEKFMSQHLGFDKFSVGHIIFAEALAKQDFQSQQELTEYIGCNKAHTSRTLFKMQLRGLIKPINSKNKKIQLTEKGRAFAIKAMEESQTLINKIFAKVDENDAQTFMKVLDLILENAEQI